MSQESDEPGERAALGDWAAAMSEGGRYGRRSKRDQSLVELETVREFSASVQAETGFGLTEIRCGQDPPDCVALYRGRTVSIELVELVDPDVRHAVIQARRHGKAFPAPERFQWGEDGTRERIGCALDKKQVLYQDRKPPICVDVLLIHVDNAWFSAAQLTAWIPGGTFSPRPNMRSAYLMLGYDGGEHLPIHNLYGAPLPQPATIVFR